MPAHAIDLLLYYAVTAEAEPKDCTPLLIDVSDTEAMAAWKAAMAAHASQAATRDYQQLQLTRARLHGMSAGVEHAIALFSCRSDRFGFARLSAGGREVFEMPGEKPLKIGITCHPTVGGSGVLASALGEELARRGHEVHFISYQRPFRLPAGESPIRFHQVGITDYGLFKYPDYTLPLSVKMAEVSRDFGLDVLHVHYAVPHATAAILARSMLPADQQPRVVTTLHGTDTTLLGRDADYGPAIHHALECSDAITAVSDYLRRETLESFRDRPADRGDSQFLFAARRPSDRGRRSAGNWDCTMK